MTRITPDTSPDNNPASGVPFWRDPWLWAVVALAAVLRLIRLGYNDLWHDEVHNLLCAEFLADLLRYGHLASNHPPLPYILLRGWRELGFGPDEFSLRLLPALAGTLGVVTLYLLAELLFDRPTARWAALLLAVSPFHILHSQDLKEYIYLPTLAPLVGYFL
ncbi:MAG TPA: glycosyltransferase family 39 protein, partial [Candidatus Hydrogenedentes bacterium]|nr:glycosyltransferase family 39 protein [Candidatus Hydrogenedentota bacterium]